MKRILILLIIFILLSPLCLFNGNALEKEEPHSPILIERNSRSIENDIANWSYITIPEINPLESLGTIKIASNDPYVHILGEVGYLRSENNGRTWNNVNPDIYGNDITISNNAIYIVYRKFKEQIKYSYIYEII